MKGLFNWLNDRLPLLSTWRRHFSDYYVPKNLNFYYLLGSIALLILLNQLITGLWLTMFYTPNASLAFSSIQYLMRDVPWGWLFRYMHSTGASIFFIVLYLHLFKAILYGSYQKPRELVWIIGVILFILLLAEAFFGYLLPWGQLSYWGAEVITSLLGAIPGLGKWAVTWVRGDFSVGNATLQRFFALHVIGIPVLIAFFVKLHLVALRQVGSNNPEGIDIYKTLDTRGKPLDGIPFHPYYTWKDAVGVIGFLILFFFIVFFMPDMGGYFLEPTNLTQANPLVTPEDITPLWYMAPFYAMLRAIPNKLVGVIGLVLSFVCLFFLPWLDKSPVRSMRYKGYHSKVNLTIFIINFVILSYLGTIPVNPVRLILARIGTLIYFTYFLLLPFYTSKEHCFKVPGRIGGR